MAFVQAEGSSSRQAPSPYRPPTVERSDTEVGQIAHSIASRRKARRRSFFHQGHQRHVKPSSSPSSIEQDDFGNETEEEWVEEDREQGSGPRLARRVWRGLQRDKIVDGPNGEDAAVHLYIKSRAGHPEERQLDLMAREEGERQLAAKEMRELREDVQPEYVWDVLFENQRGILLFGQPLFSSSTLLPFDPSAYTVPSKPLPPATSSFTVADAEGYHRIQPSTPSTNPQHKGKGKAKEKEKTHQPRKPLRTAYTPATYHTPTPGWRYLTPWLINMRSDGETDELGWEYNYVFRTRGWHSRVGKIGWGGWVRRRSWVRLRSRVLPSETKAKDEGDPTDTSAALNEAQDIKVEETEDQSQSHMPTAEESAESERQELPSAREAIDLGEAAGEIEVLHGVKRAAASLTVDRQKLAMWAKWLQEAKENQVVRDKLELVCGSSASAETYRDIKQQFIYTQSRRKLAEMLVDAGLRESRDMEDEEL